MVSKQEELKRLDAEGVILEAALTVLRDRGKKPDERVMIELRRTRAAVEQEMEDVERQIQENAQRPR